MDRTSYFSSNVHQNYSILSKGQYIAALVGKGMDLNTTKYTCLNHVMDQQTFMLRVGRKVQNQIGSQVWAQVSNEIKSEVSNQIRYEVREQVKDQVWDQAWSQVCGVK